MIKKRREENGMTQAELAKRLGVSQGAISQWESGATQPEIKHLVRLSEMFGCSVDELIRKEGT